MAKLVVFLAARPGSTVDLGGLAETIPARVVPHDASVLSGSAHGAETAEAPAFVGIVETSDDDLTGLSAALDGLGWLDRSASTVVAGPEFTVVPGEEPITLAMALTRLPSLDLAGFTEYWRTEHAALGRQVPGSEGYRQVHLDEELTEQARAALALDGPRFDGVALAYYSTGEAFRGILANPDITGPLLEDERRFIDHSRAAMVVGRATTPGS